MPSTLDHLLPMLESHRLPGGVEFGADIIYPFYQGYCLSNLPGSICRWLGAPPLPEPPLADGLMAEIGGPFQHVILLLVDGIGLDLFLRITRPDADRGRGRPVWDRLLPDGLLAALTSIVPSTTSAALTSLWTGEPAARHGITGYEVWLKEYGMIANMILHSAAVFHGDVGGLRRAGFVPETFLPVPTLGAHLLAAGVQSNAFQPAPIAHSGLSMMHMPGVNIFPYRTHSDLWITLGNLLKARSNDRTYTYVYWGDIDDLSHRYGPEDERVRLEFVSFSLMLERFLGGLRRAGRGNTLFLMTADHGHITTERSPRYEMRNHPEFLSHLVMSPTGEGRLPYLAPKPGHEQAMLAYIEAAWPGEFRLFRAGEVLESGLLGEGKVYPPVLDRIGDWVAVPQGSAYWWFAAKDNPLIGRHGGLSRQEMLVPLFAMAL